MPYFPPQQTALDILNKIKTVDGSGSGLDADTIDGLHANELSTVETLNDLTDVTISTPSTNQVLLYNGSVWVNGTFTSGVTDHGALSGLADDDHTQYLLADGSRTGASSSRQVFTNGVTTGSIRPSSNSTTALQLQNAAGSAIVTVDTTNSRFGIGGTPGYALHVVGGVGGAPYYATIVLEPSVTSNGYTAVGLKSNFGSDQRWYFGAGSGAGNNNFRIYDLTGGVEALNIVPGGNIAIRQTSATALLDIAASSAARSSLRIRSGVAPTSPNDGDIWFDGSSLKIRIGGVTKTFTVV